MAASENSLALLFRLQSQMQTLTDSLCSHRTSIPPSTMWGQMDLKVWLRRPQDWQTGKQPMLDTPTPGKTVEHSGLKHWICCPPGFSAALPYLEARFEPLSFQGMAGDRQSTRLFGRSWGKYFFPSFLYDSQMALKVHVRCESSGLVK